MFDFMSAVYAAAIAFVVCAVACPFAIPFLRRLKFGQNVRDDGPKTHLVKAGTPTMGGLVVALGIAVSSVFFLNGNPDGAAVVLVAVGFGIIGFIDDYIKVVKKRSLGLKAGAKIILQLIVCAGFWYYLYKTGNDTTIFIPFTNGYYLDLGIFYVPFYIFVMVGIVNAVNLTDGLDGLASGVTALVAAFFLFIAMSLDSGLLPVTGAVVGALLGFLMFNSHPAKVFMGDTGSFVLGGFVAATAIILKMPLVLAIVGFVYITENVSVILQVGYFKLTKGKRLFKMAPLHHHFELKGWKETRVVALFYITTAICCLIGYLATKGLF